jgi:hypothetical protein
MHQVSFRTLRRILFAILLPCVYFLSWWLFAKGSMLLKSAVVMNKYGLTAEEWVSIPDHVKKKFILPNFQTDILTHPVSYSLGIFGSLLGNKQTELEASNPAEISAEVQSEWSRSSNATYALITYIGKTTFCSLRR